MSTLKKIVIFILLPVFLTTFGEFLLKSTINTMSDPITMTACSVKTDTFSDIVHAKVQQIMISTRAFFSSPKIVFSVLCIVSGGVLWLVAISKFELSFLYPFLSINYVAIILGSSILLGEKVSIYRYFSVVFIIIGLLLISRSPYADASEE